MLEHPLELYKNKYSLTYDQLAQQLHLTCAEVYYYIWAASYPSNMIKQQIAQFTYGEVPLDAWPLPLAPASTSTPNTNSGETLPYSESKANLSTKATASQHKANHLTHSSHNKSNNAKISQPIKRSLADNLNHPLELYKNKHHLTYDLLAEQLQLTCSAVYYYIWDDLSPSAIIKQKIARLTNNEVSVDYWP